MNLNRNHRIGAIALTAVATSLAMLGTLAPSASATDIIAADQTTAAAASRPSALASIPAGIVVSNHYGQTVKAYSKGQLTRTVTRPGSTPIAFTRLTPGRVYTVTVAGRVVGRPTAVTRPLSATGLAVSTTDITGRVVLTWQQRATVATGGRGIAYDIAAIPTIGRPITTTVTGTRTATLSGLDAKSVYTFTVTPRNSAGKGRATKAMMRQTLAQLTGTDVPVAIPVASPVPTINAPAAPSPSPAPAPATGPAPAPATRTIYVCPSGYPETSGGLCQQATAYTFHTVTEHSPYTYHQEFVVTGGSWADRGTDWSGTVCPNGGTMHDGHCMEWAATGYYVSAKDAPPTGFTDGGTDYAKETSVKDALPAGYTDDGTQWVKTVAKEAKVVPA